MGRASLKPTTSNRGRFRFRLISRPYGPGLIEARDSSRTRRAVSARFPGPMGRASLKRENSARLVDLGLRFPGPMGRASLKRSKSDRGFAPREPISRPYGPGLIEATPALLDLAIRKAISRPYGPGLIEAGSRLQDRQIASRDFPALWAGPH